MIREILEYPDPRLRTIAKPVEEVTDDIRTLIDDMFETMYDARGIGLAATQVDVHKQIIVMDLSEDKTEPRVFINPKVEVLDGELEAMQEGCLSVPGFYEDVKRIEHCRITAKDRDGKEFVLEAEGLLAVCIQHEIGAASKDILDGPYYRFIASPTRDAWFYRLDPAFDVGESLFSCLCRALGGVKTTAAVNRDGTLLSPHDYANRTTQ